jgi:hypothetical protein
MNHYEAALREIETLPTGDPLHAMAKARQIARNALAVPATPSAQEVEAGDAMEWASLNGWSYHGANGIWYSSRTHEGKTTAALIALYKQSKTQ